MRQSDPNRECELALSPFQSPRGDPNPSPNPDPSCTPGNAATPPPPPPQPPQPPPQAAHSRHAINMEATPNTASDPNESQAQVPTNLSKTPSTCAGWVPSSDPSCSAPTLTSTPAPVSASAPHAVPAKKPFVKRQKLDDLTVRIASFYVVSGVHGRSIPPSSSLNGDLLTHIDTYHSLWHRILFFTIGLAHVAFALVEEPCLYWPKQDYPIITRVTAGLECGAVAYYVYDLYLLSRCSRVGSVWSRLFRHKWGRLRMLICVLMVADLITYVATGFTTFRFSRPFRILLVISRGRNIRKVFTGCLVTLSGVTGVFLIIGFVIVFYGLLGFLLLCNTGVQYFDTLQNSVYYLFLIHTSWAYNLTVLAPYYESSRWTSLFFMSFLLIVNLFLFKLVIAVAYQAYKAHALDKLKKRSKKRKHALTAAFKLLANQQGRLSRVVWLRVYSVLRPSFSAEELGLTFDAVDPLGEGHIDFSQFQHLCSLLYVTVKIQKISLGSSHPRLASLREMGRRAFTATVDIAGQPVLISQLIIMCLVLASAVQLTQVAKSEDSGVSTSWQIVGMVLLVVFSLEIILKLICLGFQEYWESGWNRLDVVCAVSGCLFYVVFSWSASAHSTPAVIYSFALGLRFLRLLRLLTLFPLCRDILAAVSAITPAVSRLLVVFLFIQYVYAIIGMQLYSSHLTPSNPVLVNTTWYAQAQELNFMDFTNSMICLFQLANLGAWSPILDASIIIGVPGWASYVFFYSYRISVSMVFLPIFVGFVLESFIKNKELIEQEQQQQAEHKQEQQQHQSAMVRHVQCARDTGSGSGSSRWSRFGAGLGSFFRRSASHPVASSPDPDPSTTPTTHHVHSSAPHSPMSSQHSLSVPLLGRSRGHSAGHQLKAISTGSRRIRFSLSRHNSDIQRAMFVHDLDEEEEDEDEEEQQQEQNQDLQQEQDQEQEQEQDTAQHTHHQQAHTTGTLAGDADHEESSESKASCDMSIRCDGVTRIPSDVRMSIAAEMDHERAQAGAGASRITRQGSNRVVRFGTRASDADVEVSIPGVLMRHNTPANKYKAKLAALETSCVQKDALLKSMAAKILEKEVQVREYFLELESAREELDQLRRRHGHRHGQGQSSPRVHAGDSPQARARLLQTSTSHTNTSQQRTPTPTRNRHMSTDQHSHSHSSDSEDDFELNMESSPRLMGSSRALRVGVSALGVGRSPLRRFSSSITLLRSDEQLLSQD